MCVVTRFGLGVGRGALTRTGKSPDYPGQFSSYLGFPISAGNANFRFIRQTPAQSRENDNDREGIRVRHAHRARGQQAGPDDRRAGAANLPDNPATCSRTRRPLRLILIYRRVRQHLLPDYEPDGCRVRGNAWPTWMVVSAAVAFASGLAAQTAAFFTLLRPGDHVIASSALYGGTITQFKHVLGKLSVDLDFVDPDDIDAWRSAITADTKLLFAETIGNPGGNVLDIEAVGKPGTRA